MANDAFEKIKSSVNRGITTISVKTSSSIEKTKIKTHIDSLEKEIEKLYANVGEAIYCEWTKGEPNYTAFNDHFELIKQKKAEIENLKVELASIDERDNQILGTAGETKVEPKPEASVPNGIVCPKCGAQYANPVRFCGKCGNKME